MTLTGDLDTKDLILLQAYANGKRLTEVSKDWKRGKTAITNRMALIRASLNAETNAHAVAIAIREGLIK